MCFFRLHLQLSCLVVLIAANSVGCQSMNGYAANSSGMGYYEQGNYTAAANEFQQAMLSNPANPDYIANFAKARARLGDTQGAEQLYRQALTIAPSHQPSYHGLAETMVVQGRNDEAASLLTTWAATQPYIAESHIELAWLQREMGQTDAAAQSLQRALQVNPNQSTALAHLGQYYEESGHPDQAAAVYQQALQVDWNQPEVHSRLAAVSQEAGAASPMAATAMARGVHPYNIPRQRTAFGPPSRGARRAQMRLAQSQAAMAGPQVYDGTMAQVPNGTQGMMSAYYNPQNMPSYENMPMSGHWESASSPMILTPDQSTSMSFGTAMPETQTYGDEWSFEGPAATAQPGEVRPVPTQDPAAGPIPDPAFSTTLSPTPTTQVSWSAPESRTPVTGTTSNELPLVEAF